MPVVEGLEDISNEVEVVEIDEGGAEIKLLEAIEIDRDVELLVTVKGVDALNEVLEVVLEEDMIKDGLLVMVLEKELDGGSTRGLVFVVEELDGAMGVLE